MTDATAKHYPVSVKGVVKIGNRFVLRRNEREEWELIGGKLDPGEDMDTCIVREITEELSVNASIAGLLNVWLYHVNKVDVVIITYAMRPLPADTVIKPEHEHEVLEFFTIDEVEGLKMPEGYKHSIALYEKGDMGDRR
jgi:8-oxo-dGTP pyrophosphatase MutT (NUDIX family)